jgi:hypothetical protein
MDQPIATIIAAGISATVQLIAALASKSASKTTSTADPGGNTRNQSAIAKWCLVAGIAATGGRLFWMAFSNDPVTRSFVVESLVMAVLLLTSIVLAISVFVIGKVLPRNIAVQLGSLTIKQARYGADDKFTDVTDAVRLFLRDGRVEMPVANQVMCGQSDPCKGRKKTLMVDYSFNNKDYAVSVNEGRTLFLP